jgi:hypothetical protein
MLTAGTQRPLFRLGIRELRLARAALAVLATVTTVVGAVLISARHLPAREGRVEVGLWLLLLGSATGLYAWLGHWEPPLTDEESSRDAQLTKRLDVVIGGVELLLLALALLGLVAPSALGGFWEEHRFVVAFTCAILALDLTVRARRRAKAAHSVRNREDRA